MKLKIKVRILTPGCKPEVNEKGDWIDLRVAGDVYMSDPQANTLKRKDRTSVRNV